MLVHFCGRVRRKQPDMLAIIERWAGDTISWYDNSVGEISICYLIRNTRIYIYMYILVDNFMPSITVYTLAKVYL